MFTQKNSFWCQINQKMVKYYFLTSNIVKHLKIIPPYGQGVERVHRFPYASYEATKRGQVLMAARAWRGTTSASPSCITSAVYRWIDSGSPIKTLPLFSYLSCTLSTPLNPILYMMRWLGHTIALPRSQHLPSLSSSHCLTFLHIPSSPPPFLYVRERESRDSTSQIIIKESLVNLTKPI